MKRAYITLIGPASRYAGPTERLVEFTFPSGKGGLLSFKDDVIEVYRLDPGVTVRVGEVQHVSVVQV